MVSGTRFRASGARRSGSFRAAMRRSDRNSAKGSDVVGAQVDGWCWLLGWKKDA